MAAGAFAAAAHGGAATPNDAFANAEVLTAPEALSTRSFAGASAEPQEPDHATDKPANRSLWYRFTAPSDGTVRFDTCSSPTNSYVAAYTGSSISTLTRAAPESTFCDPPGRARLEVALGAFVEFPVTAGTVYSLAVDTQQNTGDDVTARLVFTDVKAPRTEITKAPKKKSKKRKATFKFRADEAGASFECSLNAAPFSACTSPAKVRAKRGKNTFRVRAVDAYGNAEASPVTYKWKVKKRKRR